MKINNYEDANKVLFEIAQNQAVIAKKEAVMNERINKIRSQFEAETTDNKLKVEELAADLEKFAMKNKGDFEETRSKKLLFGEIGFRNGTPKVLQLNRKYSVATSIELLKKLFSGLYLRKKEEVDKEMILKDYSIKVLDDEKLAAVGMKIDQDENFSFKINWEALQDLQVQKVK